MRHRLGGITLLAALCLASSSCRLGGQRLLTVEIEVDHKVVLQGIRGVPDTTPVDEMWEALDDIHFEPAGDSNALTDGSSEKLDMDGNVVVRILHTDNELASASLESLTLTRDTASSAWLLSDSELDRVQQARIE